MKYPPYLKYATSGAFKCATIKWLHCLLKIIFLNINSFTLKSYLNNNNAAWTQKYKPLRVTRFIEDCYDYEEDIVTLNLMKIYGIANVRGGSYVNVNLDKSTLDTIKQKIK